MPLLSDTHIAGQLNGEAQWGKNAYPSGCQPQPVGRHINTHKGLTPEMVSLLVSG